MSSADLVQVNGFGSLFHSLIHLRMSVSSSATLRWAERRSLVASGQPVKHKHQLKTDGSTDFLRYRRYAFPRWNRQGEPSQGAYRRMASQVHLRRETPTRIYDGSGAIHPRNLRRSFDSRCKRAGVRLIRLQDTRRTCASLLRELGLHPRVATQLLRHSRISLTMEISPTCPTLRRAKRSASSATGSTRPTNRRTRPEPTPPGNRRGCRRRHGECVRSARAG